MNFSLFFILSSAKKNISFSYLSGFIKFQSYFFTLKQFRTVRLCCIQNCKTIYQCVSFFFLTLISMQFFLSTKAEKYKELKRLKEVIC